MFRRFPFQTRVSLTIVFFALFITSAAMPTLVLAQVDDEFAKQLPTSVLELGDIKTGLLEEFRAKNAEFSATQKIDYLKKIVLIETKAIEAFESGNPAALLGFGDENPDDVKRAYLEGTVANGAYLADLLNEVGRLEEAIQVRKYVVDNSTKRYGANHWRTGNASRVHQHSLWTEKASNEQRETYRHAIEIRDQGLRQLNSGEVVDAIQSFVKGLNLLEGLQLTETDSYATMLFNHAYALARNGEIEAAESTYKKVIEAEERILGPSSPSLAQTMYSMAVFYRNTGNPQQGIEILQRSQQVNRAAFGPDSHALAKDLFGVARLQHDLNDSKSATQNYTEAFQMLDRIGERNSELTLDILNNQQALFETADALEDAAVIAEVKVKIAYQVFGRNSVAAANYLFNQGIMLKATGDRERADEIFILAKAKFESNEGFALIERYITLLDNMAMNLNELNRLDEAEALSTKATELAEQSDGKESLLFAVKSQNLALILSDQKKFAAAESRLNEALKILEKVVGRNHQEYITTFSNLAYNQLNQQHFDQAIEIWKQTSELKREFYGERSKEYIQSLATVADVYRRKGDEASAKKFTDQQQALLAAAQQPEPATTVPPPVNVQPEPPATVTAAPQAAMNGQIGELQTRLDEMISLLESGDVEKILADLIPPEQLEQFQQTQDYERIKSNFAESKLPILLQTLKSIDVSQAKIEGDSVVFTTTQSRPLSWTKIDGKWYIKN